jgi:hypothetical protein
MLVVIHFLKRFVNRRRPSICRLGGWPRGGAADRYVSAAANKKIHQVGRRESDAKRRISRQNVTLRHGQIVALGLRDQTAYPGTAPLITLPQRLTSTHRESSFHYLAASGHFFVDRKLVVH